METTSRLGTATPLTVKQILRASRIHSDAPFMLDGCELDNVYCVGLIVYLEERDTFYMIKFDDGSTGLLTVFLFKRKNTFATSFASMVADGSVREQKYARFMGEISRKDKAFGNSIWASSILPVDDYHEIFFHVLECIIVSKKSEELQMKRGKETEECNARDSSTSGPLIDGTGLNDNNDSEQPPSEESLRIDPPDDSSSSEDETECVPEKGNDESESDDTSDEECGEIRQANDEVLVKSDDSDNGLHVEGEAKAEVKTVITSESELEPSGQEELSNVQSALEGLSLSSAGQNNMSSLQINPSDAEPHRANNSIIDPLATLSNMERALILHILRRRDEIGAEGEEEWVGVHITELMRVFERHRSDITASEMDDTLNSLVDNGHIFTTVDESRFDVFEF